MISISNHGAIRQLRLNRPPVNALNLELVAALRQAVEAAPQDGARALVLSGAPGRFSAGLDVPLLLGLDRAAMAALWREFYALLKALAGSPIPIVAVITGHAPAGGTVLPLFCDWRVGAEGEFKLGLSEVQVGIILPPMVLAALRRQIGPRQAERLAVTGALISPQEALQVGLLDEVVAVDRVVDRALEWCQTLLAFPAEAMAVTRRNSRADLVALCANFEAEIDVVTEGWWSPETQRSLRTMVDRLKKKSS
ncbi:MAG: enoyl-CoA hydratase/isomerase family protein [Terriglobales bacterium]|jgi:Delta3-Delta2-enoyl-CoA isomerase